MPQNIDRKVPITRRRKSRGCRALSTVRASDHLLQGDCAHPIDSRTQLFSCGYDPDARAFVLLLEDLDHYEIGDQVAGNVSPNVHCISFAMPW